MGDASGGDVPVKLMIESTPEFMQLPLEYQGFCPWTIVHRHGLLMPGKPALGVVRYKNAFFVFAHAVAMQQFMAAPDKLCAAVIGRAGQSPELIHLLRLQEQFPGTSIAKLLSSAASAAGNHAGGLAVMGAAMAPPEKKDAATETPTHFVEKHIDPSYHWNEWALRRRAMQLTNLKKCITSSQQTDLSHFHRENDSQVYLPADQKTQTMSESSTQHARTVQYLGGLRGNDFTSGAPVALQHSKTPALNSFAAGGNAQHGGVPGVRGKAAPAVVDLTFEL